MNESRLLTIFLLIVVGGMGRQAFAQPGGPFPQPDRISQLVHAKQLVPQMLPPPPADSAFAIRIKDITQIEGHRVNRVVGLGLVTGLKGTGGKSSMTQDFGRNMLRNFDILTANPPPTGSTAVVTVSAEIPAFLHPGESVSATVSVLDDASGLYGGELLNTPLVGFDRQVYAVASGALTVGGFSAGGAAGGVSKNHDTAAKVQAIIEVGIQAGPAFPGPTFRLLLKNKDYTTSYRIAAEINRYFPGHARPTDQGSVEVAYPRTYLNSKMDFVVLVNNLRVTPDAPARVVINQKTGTIVVGQQVRLSKIMFAKDNLIITTTESPVASQPAPLSEGETVVLPRTQVTATESGGRYNLINQQTTVGDLAAALNTLGVTPQDLINIFQSIERSGGLQATLVIE